MAKIKTVDALLWSDEDLTYFINNYEQKEND
jgi:hypothetical protein